MSERPDGVRSNTEDILRAALGEQVEYKNPNSPIEYYLVKLKEAIDAGGNIDDILVAGANITITKNADGTITIAASGEVSSEDLVAREAIAAIKDGEVIDSFGDVESALNDKADATDIPTTLAELTDDSTHRVVSDTEKSTWNNKVDNVQGKGLSTNDYTTAEKTKLAGIAEGAEVNVQADWNQTTTTADDYIKNKPTIPTVNDSTITIQKNRVTVDSFTTNAATGKTINITMPTTAAEVDALPDTTKYGAALSLTINSSTYVVTAQLKDQNGDNLGQAQTIDLPLESVVVSGSYDSQTKKVVLTLQSGSTVEFSVADLVAGLQSEITANNKLSSDLVDDANATHKFVTASEKTTWNSKQDALSQAQLSAVNSGATATKIGQIETNKNNILLLEQMNGAKNLAKVAIGTRTGSGYFFANETSKIIDSNTSVYIVFDYELESGQASVQLTDNNGNVIINTSVYTTAGTTSGHNAAKVTLTKAAYGYNAYYNSTGAVTISNMMIIPAEIYDAGFTDYQPYAPTNAELYAMIQALQS